MAQLTDLRFEHHPDGFGVGTPAPRLSWRFSHGQSPAQNWSQTAYEVEIRRGSEPKPELFHVDSGNSVLNPWPSQPLASRARASVRVRAFGSDGGSTEWSSWQDVEAGLLQRSDWAANFITSPDDPPKDKPHRPTLFRQTFSAQSLANARARLYITSLGVYEAHINGRRVGDLQMTPGWTSYRHRLQYQVYDVTSLLQEGDNAIGVEVAEGWYAGRLRWGEGVRNFYGDRLGVLAQLEIQLDDGSQQKIITDDGWRTHQSSLVTSELYDGEVYHAHEEPGDWTSPAFSAGSRWQPARLLDFPKIDLILPDVPPVRVTEALEPCEIFKSKSGKTLLDFGQNLVGKIFIRSLQKPDGHILKIRHAEVLEKGELGTRPLRNARAEDTVVFSKQPLKDWSPRFTFHGFRYVQIEGWSLEDEAPPAKGSISALVMHSDMQRTGHFHCSNDLVNKLHQNVVWSMRGNFLSIPTDCPQRDERLGWTGDIQVFSPTASYLYSSGGLLANWLQDVAAEQADAGGIVPLVVPDVLGGTTWPSVPQAVWDDAAILVPWTLYRWTGDAAVLRRQLPSMRAHLDAAVRRGPDGLWDAALWQLGDWLDPAAPPREPGLARTDGTLVADAYLVRVTDTVARVCEAVGESALAARYRADHARLRAVFAAKYVAPSGLLVGDTQTALALALCFSLHDGGDEQVRVAADRLARLVRYSKFRVSTGFAGTPLVLAALSGAGHVQLAYRMLLEEKCPSWLYPVTMGSTTIWERWDSMLADGSINPGEMTSFNHYALGSVADWLHTTVGGLSPLEPGWKTFRVGPVPGGTVTTAEVRFESPHGTVESEWVVEGEGEGPKKFKLKVNVPPNTSALIVLPGQKDEDGVWVGSGSHQKESAYEPPGQWPPKAMYTQFKEGLE